MTSGATRQAGDPAADDLVALTSDAVRAGVDVVQVREPNLSDGDLLALTRRVVGAAEGSRTAVVVNDRIDVALAAPADGTHLRGSAMPASRVRALAGSEFLIGRSVHTVMEARQAQEDGGADYLIFGTVFPSAGKPEGHPVAGVEALADVCASVRLPVLAIGGITAARAADVAAAGASGIAGIGVFAAVGPRSGMDLTDLVRRLRQFV